MRIALGAIRGRLPGRERVRRGKTCRDSKARVAARRRSKQSTNSLSRTPGEEANPTRISKRVPPAQPGSLSKVRLPLLPRQARPSQRHVQVRVVKGQNNIGREHGALAAKGERQRDIAKGSSLRDVTEPPATCRKITGRPRILEEDFH